MDPLEEVLRPKGIPAGLDWNSLQKQVLRDVLERRGFQADDMENYSSYLPLFARVIEENYRATVVHGKVRHEIRVSDVCIYLPDDDPEMACFKGNYECTVTGTVTYTMSRNPDDCDEENDGPVSLPVVVVPPVPDILSDGSKQPPSMTRGNGTREWNEAFRFNRSDGSEFSEIVFSHVQRDFVLMSLPALLRSQTCRLRNGSCNPLLSSKPYLCGGMFIVNRTLKVCPDEGATARNRPLIRTPTQVEIRCDFREWGKRFRTNSTLKVEVVMGRAGKRAGLETVRGILLEVPHETPRSTVSVPLMAMAYGWSPEAFQQTVRRLMPESYTGIPDVEMLLTHIVNVCQGVTDQRSAILKVGKSLSKCRSMDTNNPDAIVSYVTYTLRSEFFPHLVDPTCNDVDYENLRKGFALARIVADLIMASPRVSSGLPEGRRREPFDRRSYENKHVISTGDNMGLLLRKLCKNGSRRADTNLGAAVRAQKPVDLNAVMKPTNVNVTGSVRSGTWDSGMDTSDSNRNKTQMVITGFVSSSIREQATRRIELPVMRKSADTTQMLTHPTMNGRIDTLQTPETESCGKVRHKASGCIITPIVDMHAVMYMVEHSVLRRYAEEIRWAPLSTSTPPPGGPLPPRGYATVADVWGGTIGWCGEPSKLYRRVVELRRSGTAYRFLGVVWERACNIVRIVSDEGRLVRPLVVADRLDRLDRAVRCRAWGLSSCLLDWLCQCGAVEYMAADEEYGGMVLVAPGYDDFVRSGGSHTHIEIHGVLHMSEAGCNVYCTMNVATRRLYAGNQGSRAISTKSGPDRGTHSTHTLLSGQLPLVSNPVEEHFGMRQSEPDSTNMVVMLAAMEDTVEDALIASKDSIERGALMTGEYRVWTDTIVGTDAKYARPDGCDGRAHSKHYHALLPNGLPQVGKILTGGDAVVGKVVPYNRPGDDTGGGRGTSTRFAQGRMCNSRFLQWNETYRVVKVETLPDPDHPDSPDRFATVRVTLFMINIPIAGDKLFARHGQKGVIARLVPRVDMPFVADGDMAGVSPDLVFNMCAVTRCTVGMLREMLDSVARAYDPNALDPFDTVFTHPLTAKERARAVEVLLTSRGLSKTGKYNVRMGTTGQMVEGTVFMGMLSISVPPHMAAKKMRARGNTGPVNALTRQPPAGASKVGGLRLGEMEVQALYSHGAAHLLQSMNPDNSDPQTLYWCVACQMAAYGNPEIAFYMCPGCRVRDNIVAVQTAYKTVLVTEELKAAGIGVRLQVERVTNTLDMHEHDLHHA